jgi:predicted ribosome quality control (RQC) complex YloA/Tae2 family protein
MIVRLYSMSEKARFPTRYVAEFRKHFKGSLINAINSIKFPRIPIELMIHIGKYTTLKLLSNAIVKTT